MTIRTVGHLQNSFLAGTMTNSSPKQPKPAYRAQLRWQPVAIVLIIAGGLYGTVASVIRRSREGSDAKPESDEPEEEPKEES